MFDFLNDCLSTIPEQFELEGKIVTKQMVQEKGLILARSGKLSNNPVVISSNLVGWSDNKTHTTSVNNRVLSLVKFTNADGEVVKVTSTFHAEVDGETYLASLLLPTPLASSPIWDEDVFGVLAQWGLQLQLIADITASEVNGKLELFTRSNSLEEYLRVYAVNYVLWIPSEAHAEKVNATPIRLAKGPKIRPNKPIQLKSVQQQANTNNNANNGAVLIEL
jgi:hypothetical protein